MKIEESRLCLLCLRTDSSEIFEEIGDTVEETLEALQLKLNFQIGREHVVCSDCIGSINKCFNFKLACMNTEKLILPFYNFENQSKLDLREVYMQKNMNKSTDDVPKDQKICRLCMELNKGPSCERLLEIEKDILLKCIPELNFNMTKEPVICNSCLNSLRYYYEFLQNYTGTEEALTKYYQFGATDSEGQTNLKNVVQSTKNVLEFEKDFTTTLCSEANGNDVIKTEGIVKEENTEFDRMYGKIDIKTEFEENFIKVEEHFMKVEINEESLNLHHGKLDETCEEIMNEQSNLERFRDAPTSSQFIMNNINIYNSKDQVETDQEVLSEVSIKNSENLNEMQSEFTVNKCQISPFISECKAALRRHLLLRGLSEKLVHKCERCLYVAKQKWDLKMHMLVHQELSEVTVYKCQSCSFVTKQENIFKSHMAHHISIDKCESCPSVGKHRSSPFSPKLIHNSSEIYKCYQCSYEGKLKWDLKRHMLTHQGVSEGTMYTCESCSFVAKNKSYLKSHRLVHQKLSEGKVYTCESCSYVGKRKSDLNSHNKLIHLSTELTAYNCDQCSFKTKYRATLKRHMTIHQEHSEVTKYMCEKCSFRTKYKGNLKSHMLVHQEPSDITLHRCKSCSFGTKHRSNLNVHMLTHRELSEATLHKCEICSYVTRVKGALKSHMLTHRELTMHKCLSCSYITKHKSSLNRHMLTHREPAIITPVTANKKY